MLTTSQIDRLGERLRASTTISEDELDLLHQYRAEHSEARRVVQERIEAELPGEPPDPNTSIGREMTRQDLWNAVSSFSKTVADVEEVAAAQNLAVDTAPPLREWGAATA